MMGWGVLMFLLGIACAFVGGTVLFQGEIKALPLMLVGIAIVFLAPRLDGTRGFKDEHDE